MKYSFPHNSEVVVDVGGKKDTAANRKKAMDKFQQMVESGQLELPEGFTAEQLVPIPPPADSTSETPDNPTDPIVRTTEAVRQFAKVKTRLEENFAQAKAVFKVLQRVFEDEESLTSDDISLLESSTSAAIEYTKALKEKVSLIDDVAQARSLLEELLASEMGQQLPVSEPASTGKISSAIESVSNAAVESALSEQILPSLPQLSRSSNHLVTNPNKLLSHPPSA